MARSRINSASKDLVSDDGAVLISIIQGEQIRFKLTLNWITNLTGHDVSVKIVEADMSTMNKYGKPASVLAGGVTTTLPLIDTLVTDNVIDVVIPSTLSDSWAAQPTPESPVYGWVGVRVADPGTGDEQQIWKFMRGLVEVLYSPTKV